MIEGYIFSSTLKEFFRFRRIAAWFVVVIAVFAISMLYRYVSPASEPQQAYVLLSDTLVFRILPLAAAIFSTAIVAQEVEQKTIVYLLTRPVPRWKLLLFRTLAAMVVVFAIAFLCAATISLAIYHGANPILWRDMPALAAGAAAYVAVFVFLSLLMNKSMIVCLLFAFVWETSVPNMPGDLYRLTITSYLSGIARHPASDAGGKGLLDALSGILGVNTIPLTTAWLSMAVLVLLSLVASCLWFGSFEYSPREDAG